MEINNEFTVSVPLEQAWRTLTDLEKIAPCMPGAKLEEVSGEDYVGSVKIKVGPITSTYRGKLRFAEKDDTAHRAVLRAEGRDTKGQGNATADITAELTEVDGKTVCKIHLNLTISGRVAQFGRGVLADVSQKLVEQFVENLEEEVLGVKGGSSDALGDRTEELKLPEGATGESLTEVKDSNLADETTVRSVNKVMAERHERKEGKELNALSLVAKPVAKRLLPVFAVAVVLGVLLRRRKRK
ncbi:hypothetical protein SAMN02745225_01389 [Ferrithrix thermotolerans DSM 19514]|uniref:Carbon monoxide dehydrogenase subunit G n=1 Tax=Ferrithrix thermotolerans DSM 19514 TaxID=1121881 RepID=A0A1M4VQ04_9ACTN|nr:SRPBCC family protein [Ferrithrix thermotolerans]SHE70945.1 hypothetical protein SAMN02745225_01389 [Ferrithrix thermotolerans DSM 19514]